MKPKSVYLLQGTIGQKAIQKIKIIKGHEVFVCEGRPLLESGRLLSKALLKRGVTPTLISDNMPGFLFFKGWVKEVITACHYANETGALCDCGALILAVLAHKHKIPFKLLASEPRSRFLGDPQSLFHFEGKQITPDGARGYVPLVEWVPVRYLT